MISIIFILTIASLLLIFITKSIKNHKKSHIVFSIIFSAILVMSVFYSVSECSFLVPSIGKQELKNITTSIPKAYVDNFGVPEQQFDAKEYEKLSASFLFTDTGNYYRTVCYKFRSEEEATSSAKFMITNQNDFSLSSLKIINKTVKYKDVPEQMYLTSVPNYLLKEEKNGDSNIYYSPTRVSQYNRNSYLSLGGLPGGEYATAYAFKQNEFIFVIYEKTYCNNTKSQIDELMTYLNSENTEINFEIGYHVDI